MQIVTNSSFIMTLCLAIPGAIAQSAPGPNAAGPTQIVAVENGAASFFLPTNIPAIEISGKSSALHARVQVQRDANGVTLEHIEAWMPVKTLVTGMALRDQHMRKHIFTTAAGDIPDLRFESGKIDCPGVAPGREATCAVTGALSIRGAAKAFSIPLKVRQETGSGAFRAMGDGVVKLSDYGIEQPSQLGVKTSNEVKIHLDLSGSAQVTTAMGRPQ